MSRVVDEDSDPQRRTFRERLIEESQERVHRSREDVDKSRILLDSVPRDVRMRLQADCLSYYRALRPLRTEGVVNKWWQEVILSEDWIAETRVTEEPVVRGSIDGASPRVETERRRVNIHYKGLDVLDSLDEMTEHYRETIRDMRGVRVEEGERAKVLPAKVLIDVSEVLDDASKRLGFAPPTRLQEGETAPV